MKKVFYKLLLATVMLLLGVGVNAVTRVSTGSGDYNTAGTWDPSGKPANTDDLTIKAGHTITNSSSGSAKSLVIEAGGTLTVSSAITAVENITINGTVNCTGNIINVGANYNIIVSDGGLINYNRGSSWGLTGGLKIETGGTVEMVQNKLTVGKNLEVQQGGSFAFGATGSALSVSGETICNGTIDLTTTSSNSTLTGAVSGTGTIIGGETRTTAFTAASTSSFFAAGGGTLVLNTPGAGVTLTSYNNLTIKANSSSKTFAAATVYGNLTVNAPMPLAGNITVLGNISNTSSVTGSPKLILGGTSVQELGGTGSFNNLEIAAGAIASLTSNVTVAGTFTNNGTLICNGFTLTANGVAQDCTPDGPYAKLTSTEGTNEQSIIQTGSITAIEYTLGGGATNTATTVTWSGASSITPSWVTVNTATEGKITITATAELATTIGDYLFTITPSDGSATGDPLEGKITVTAFSTPAPTIVLTSGAATQSKKAGEAISIVYTLTNEDEAIGATTTGLPAGWTPVYDAVAHTYTISGTLPVESTYPTVYDYEVTVASLVTYLGAEVKTTGALTVKDPDARNVAFLVDGNTAAAQPYSGANKLFTMLDSNYDVTTFNMPTAADVTGIVAEGYDLVVLHESLPSSNAGAVELGKYIGQIPILNTKAHMYGKTNWPGGSGQNGSSGDVSINILSGFGNHQIFTGLTPTDGNLVISNSGGIIRYVNGTITKGTPIASNQSATATNVSILEDITSGAEKYMLIALSASTASQENLNDNGLLLFKNACDYLMGISAAPGTEAKILTFTIGDTEGTVDEDAKTIDVVMPVGTALTSLDVTLTMSRGASLIAPASQIGIDFTGSDVTPITFTVQSEDLSITNDYLVSVTVASNPAPTIEFAVGEDGNRTVEQGEAITAIMFDVTNVGGDITVEGLPTGLDIDKVTGTISGTVDAAATIKAYDYTVSVPAIDAGVAAATISGTITVNKAIVPYAGGFPYSTTIEAADGFGPASSALPAWMDGQGLSYNGNYEGGDAGSFVTGSTVLRLAQGGDYVDMYIADATELGVIEITINATGSRTFKLYIDDFTTPLDTKTRISNATASVLTYDASALTGAITIRVVGEGGGGSTIGAISFAEKIGTGFDNASLNGIVYASNGAIIIKAETGDAVAVFTVSGQKVLAAKAKGEMSIPVAKGAYIVKLNNAHKIVLVK